MADEEAATSMAPAGGLGRSSSANALQVRSAVLHHTVQRVVKYLECRWRCSV